MRILRKHCATLLRRGDTGYYDENGNYIEGISTVTTDFRCCIQPEYKGELEKDLPEGIRAKDCKFIYTATQLQGASESRGVAADILRFDGNTRYGDTAAAEEYEVHSVQRWLGAGRVDAWMVLAIRKDKLRG